MVVVGNADGDGNAASTGETGTLDVAVTAGGDGDGTLRVAGTAGADGDAT